MAHLSRTDRTTIWYSAAGVPAPARVVACDGRMRTGTAYRLARSGTALLWRGDFVAARRMLRALGRHADGAAPPAGTFAEHRRRRAEYARIRAALLVPLGPGPRVPLRAAPDVRAACAAAYGRVGRPGAVALTALLGALGAERWRRVGVPVPALGARIHPHYGVFAPTRHEYVDLVAAAPLPATTRAYEVGTGTGVLAAVLARRGVAEIVATDTNVRAVRCATENLHRLGYGGRVTVLAADLFPPGRAPLVVCNPPWLPATPAGPLDTAVYDPDSVLLRRFLAGLADHLVPGGEGWLVLSDLAERFGLRTRAELLAAVDGAGLRVLGRLDTAPRHPRATADDGPLGVARAGEVVSLWRLAPA
ncbi:methyltransferase [Actinocatenispora rupis]|uniref:Methyltransferase small domain-containing protein n=1 Tax=Actinocatenispora rupis TaxID=519421 RepID=A0A8J3J7V4_9ACTN|nr:class I SAM-dependent methyltransferase [Actinocatenispora rupis]GID11008.1 hypothetical protein Aru02nite_18970 [Actinocatenispora rupis]